MPTIIISTLPPLKAMISTLLTLPTSPPSLYLDLEGINLSRHGTVSILQILAEPTQTVYLIDTHTLGTMAFYTPNETGTTLRSILESPSIPKVFFDVRSDSDALYAHFGIALRNVIDVQLLEAASRPSNNKARLKGLQTCIERHCELAPGLKLAAQYIKQAGLNLFSPERGGSYEVFNQRPMPNAIVDYCAQDVLLLPRLWRKYMGRIELEWARLAEDETRKRVWESQAKTYREAGSWRALSPWP